MKLPRWLCEVLLVLLGLTSVVLPQSAIAQIYWIEAPEFAPPNTGGVPEFGDLDADGDYDLIYAIVLHSYRNVGSPTLPSWLRDDSLVEGVDYVNSMTTCLADLDADGDLDLSVGMLYGEAYPLFYYENVGSATQPVWQQQNSMYESLSPGSWTCPELADLDDDGDLDLVLAVYWGLRAYRNTGTPQVPSWTRDDSFVDGVSLAHACSDPNLADLDDDGDLDIVLGSTYGDSPIVCFENIGTAQTPEWNENGDLLTDVPMSVGSWGLDLEDLDADGDIDLLVIRGNGPKVYLNLGSVTPVEPSSWGRIKALFRQP
jgi:hypothetical protein